MRIGGIIYQPLAQPAWTLKSIHRQTREFTAQGNRSPYTKKLAKEKLGKDKVIWQPIITA